MHAARALARRCARRSVAAVIARPYAVRRARNVVMRARDARSRWMLEAVAMDRD